MEKSCPGSKGHPRCPGRANFPYIALQNLTNRLHEKEKAGSARRMTRLAGSVRSSTVVVVKPALDSGKGVNFFLI